METDVVHNRESGAYWVILDVESPVEAYTAPHIEVTYDENDKAKVRIEGYPHATTN